MSDIPPLALLLVFMLATARLSGLATGEDEITAAAVLRLKGKINPASLESGWRFYLSYFVSCMWCMSVWIGALLMAVAHWHGTEPWVLIPAMALAASQVTGLLSGVGRD
jgi:hypothetical protein